MCCIIIFIELSCYLLCSRVPSHSSDYVGRIVNRSRHRAMRSSIHIDRNYTRVEKFWEFLSRLSDFGVPKTGNPLTSNAEPINAVAYVGGNVRG